MYTYKSVVRNYRFPIETKPTTDFTKAEEDFEELWEQHHAKHFVVMLRTSKDTGVTTSMLKSEVQLHRQDLEKAVSMSNQKKVDDFYDEQVRKMFPPGSNQHEMMNWVEQPEPSKGKSLQDTVINPAHYQGIVGNLQYIEVCEYLLGVEGLKAHLKGQAYKYQFREGKKDATVQELSKASWYLQALIILEREGTIIGQLGRIRQV